MDNSQDKELDRFLDGLMSPEEEARFIELHRDDMAVQKAIDLQSQLDDSIKRIFATNEMDRLFEDQVVDQLSLSSSLTTEKNWTRRYWVKEALVAALVAIAAFQVWWQFAKKNRAEPFFEQVALVELHNDLQGKGYSPYYNCEDEERFASVFKARQGLALKLAPMPADRKMLGLSYVGGISRQTTAMLSKVQDRNVTVFVDRDTGTVDEMIVEPTSGLNVFKRKMSGLVFYEVSPLDKPHLLEYFQPASE